VRRLRQDELVADSIHLSRADASVRIEPDFGGRLSSFRVGDHELLWQLPETSWRDEPFGWGSFVMAPYAGRIRRGVLTTGQHTYQLPISMPPHAIHGSVHSALWSVDAVEQSVDGARAELSTSVGEEWPFAGTIRHLIELGDGFVTQTLTLDARDAMPVTMGWHPWFPRVLPGATGPVSWSLSAQGDEPIMMFARDADGIPDGSLVEPPAGPWDDCFLGVDRVTVSWPGLLDLHVDHDCPVVVLFDGLDHAVCVEPQTGPPDAAAIWPKRSHVPGGGSQTASTTWSW
jgi:aldose 1-epimerase